jgi:hypothetical protein
MTPRPAIPAAGRSAQVMGELSLKLAFLPSQLGMN